MKNFFEQAISGVNDLIKIRTQMSTIYINLEKSKEATAMQFKIKNYHKWIDTLNNLMTKNINVQTQLDIKNLKLTNSLETKLIELLENGEITDIELSKSELNNLEKISETNNESLTNSTMSVDSNVEQVTVDNKIDTSTIEAVPKILADIQRPTDKIGSAAYDLRFIHGIGEKIAEKFAKDGITLELLMEDWNNFIKKNQDNVILMYSKMKIPESYTKKQWTLLDENRQRGIQSQELEKKLKQDTKCLYKLNISQLLGLKYFYDMSQKIPRDEVEKIETILKKLAQRLNPDINVCLCGSYRRGRARSGDIDCLITHPAIKTKEDLETAQTNILSKFVKILTDVNFIIDHLTDYGKSKYMGFCMINYPGRKINIARRIDIKFIPYNSFGAAILYFTGSKNFNTLMRSFARTKGYMLNEYGLVRQSDNILISCPDELDAFKILNYPYKKPEERDI
jgi:DNA polymerase beta